MILSSVALTTPPVSTKQRYNCLGSSLLVASQLFAQPPIAAVGQDGHGRVQVNIEANLTGQTVEMEEIHADSQAVFHSVTTSVADDHISGSFFKVV